MNTGIKILFASCLAMTAATSAYAAEEDALVERGTYMSANASVEPHVAVKRDHAHHAIEARAYSPAGTWSNEVVDFGIGSQR